MASTVSRSQSDKAALGCGRKGDSHHGCGADKSTATVWRYHDNTDPKELFQHLVEFMSQRIKAVQKGKSKGGINRY